MKEYVDGVVAGDFPDFNEAAQKVNKCVADPEFRFGNLKNVTVLWMELCLIRLLMHTKS